MESLTSKTTVFILASSINWIMVWLTTLTCVLLPLAASRDIMAPSLLMVRYVNVCKCLVALLPSFSSSPGLPCMHVKGSLEMCTVYSLDYCKDV